MQMLVFWTVAGGMMAISLATMARALWRRPTPGASPDLTIYREQLDELERDVARSTLSVDDAARLRIEISRRMLEADRAARRPSAPVGRTVGLLGLAVGAVAALPLYLHLGATGYPDLGLSARIDRIEDARARRPSQAEAERPPPQADIDPQYADLLAQLRAAVAATPDDVTGLRLLVRNEAGVGNFAAAAEAQRQLLTLDGADDAAQYSLLAELLVRATGGYVSPEAESALRQGLRRDPEDPTALYLLGMTMAQGGRPDQAYRHLSHALRVAPDAPWRADVLGQMPELASLAGARWTPPDPVADPAADIAALPPEDQAAAIRGMVDGLAARLEQGGGTPDEWARLIRAYGVLGRPDAARDAWQRARAVLTNDADRALMDATLAEVGLE